MIIRMAWPLAAAARVVAQCNLMAWLRPPVLWLSAARWRGCGHHVPLADASAAAHARTSCCQSAARGWGASMHLLLSSAVPPSAAQQACELSVLTAPPVVHPDASGSHALKPCVPLWSTSMCLVVTPLPVPLPLPLPLPLPHPWTARCVARATPQPTRQRS